MIKLRRQMIITYSVLFGALGVLVYKELQIQTPFLQFFFGKQWTGWYSFLTGTIYVICLLLVVVFIIFLTRRPNFDKKEKNSK